MKLGGCSVQNFLCVECETCFVVDTRTLLTCLQNEEQKSKGDE